jgi:hypothetical protein
MIVYPRRGIALAMWLWLLSAGPAVAQGCSAYLFPQSVADVTVAVVHASHLPMLRDDEGCPAAGSKCEGKAYLIDGDHVLVSSTHGDYRCAAFATTRSQSTGWISIAALSPMPLPKSEGDWSGAWKRVQGHASLTIRKRNTVYIASGIATYAVGPDNVRTGAASGRLKILSSWSGVVAQFGDGGSDPISSCTVEIRQLGPRLLVNDGATDDANSGCGGMGVTFNRIYIRDTKIEARHRP